MQRPTTNQPTKCAYCLFRQQQQHHLKKPKNSKRIPLPKEIYDALHHLLFNENWSNRELFYELGRPDLNPIFSTSHEMQTLFDWVINDVANYDTLLRAIHNGFYIEVSPEAQLDEYMKYLKTLDEPYRQVAIDTAEEVLTILGIIKVSG